MSLISNTKIHKSVTVFGLKMVLLTVLYKFDFKFHLCSISSPNEVSLLKENSLLAS